MAPHLACGERAAQQRLMEGAAGRGSRGRVHQWLGAALRHYFCLGLAVCRFVLAFQRMVEHTGGGMGSPCARLCVQGVTEFGRRRHSGGKMRGSNEPLGPQPMNEYCLK